MAKISCMKRFTSKYASEFNFVIQAKRKDSENFEDTIYGANSLIGVQNKVEELKSLEVFNKKTQLRIVRARKTITI